jgi:hypothetical protein
LDSFFKDEYQKLEGTDLRPVYIWEATDGNLVPFPKSFKDGGGPYGCKVSHMRALENALHDKLGCVAVLEDDCVFHPEFAHKYQEFMSALPDDWDAVLLGGSYDARFPSTVVNDLVVKANGFHRTHSYIVRGKYIGELYKIFADASKHIDGAWCEQMRHANVYAPHLWLVGQSAGKSDVSGHDDEERWWHCPPPAAEKKRLLSALPIPQIRTVTKARGCTGCGKKAPQVKTS